MNCQLSIKEGMGRQAKSGMPLGKIRYTRCRNWASPPRKSGIPNLSAGNTDDSDNEADDSNKSDEADGEGDGKVNLIIA